MASQPDPVDASFSGTAATNEPWWNAGRLQTNAAFLIAILALLATLGSVSDGNATESAARNNVLAVDTYAFFQSKNTRQTDYQIAVNDIRFMLDHSADLDDAARRDLSERLAIYEETIARYESEPDPADPNNLLKGEGKEQLLAQARHYEDEAKAARRRGASFDHTTASAQIGIVLASAAILTGFRVLLAWSAFTGVLSFVFFLNALFSVVDIPFPLRFW